MFVFDSVSEDAGGQNLREKHSQTVAAPQRNGNGKFAFMINPN